MTFYHATLETMNFSFDGYGVTHGEALRALESAWWKHRRQYQATDTWNDVIEDVRVRVVRNGEAWRDGERLLRIAKAWEPNV